MLHNAKLISTPDDGNIYISFGKPSVLFVASLAFYYSSLRCNFLLEDEVSVKVRRVGYGTTNKCYNEQFFSIKSGCYNEHRCYNERGGILL
jgi:hypothetical protein